MKIRQSKLRAISQQVPKLIFYVMSVKIILLKLLLLQTWANELKFNLKYSFSHFHVISSTNCCIKPSITNWHMKTVSSLKSALSQCLSLLMASRHWTSMRTVINNYRCVYHETSNIRHTKSQNFNVSHLVWQLFLPNPLKPGVKSRMKM